MESYNNTTAKPYQQVIDVTGTFNFFSKSKKKNVGVILDSKSSYSGNRQYTTNYVVQKEIEHCEKIGLNLGFRMYQSNKAVLSTYTDSFSDSMYFISDNSRYILKTGIRFQGNHNYEVDFKTKKTSYQNKIYFIDINFLTMLNGVSSYMMYQKSKYEYSSVTIPNKFSGDKQSMFGAEIATSMYKQYNNNLWTSTIWSIGFIPGRFQSEGTFSNFMFKLNYTIGFAL